MKNLPTIKKDEAPPANYTGFMVSEAFYYIFVIGGRPLQCGESFPKKLMPLNEAHRWYHHAGCIVGELAAKATLIDIYKHHSKHPIAGPILIAHMLGNGE
jgi:hypothetical protein